jgi:hypothetical protein
MQKLNFILLDKIPDDVQNTACNNALRYALFSLPFTVNRMAFDDIEKRVENICKGKIAEYLFLSFLKHHRINFDEASCLTPYYLPDNRDFLMGNYEWDIKNNFLHHHDLKLIENPELLPALIPDRFKGDQWTKRLKTLFPEKKGVAFVFTFMPLKNKNGKNIFKLQLSASQLNHLQKIKTEWSGKKIIDAPYPETYLENIYFAEQSLENSFQMEGEFQMLITSIAGPKQWSNFELHQPQNYCKGLMKTRIQNRACEVGKLPAFYPFFRNEFRSISWGILI